MRQPVPVMSLASVNEGVDLEGAIGRVLRSGRFVLGASVERFEEAFARYCGTEHGVGVASGTDALELALRALGVATGDRVVTVANAGGYSTTAIRACGAVPLYVDVEPGDLTMSADALRGVVPNGPAAIIVTHLYGRLADIDAIRDVAGGIPIIEDGAQAHGAMREGERAGSLGDIGCFSFYPTKNLGAIGDAGAVVTSDPVVADRTRKLRQYGWGEKYEVVLEGGRNSRLDEVQAAILLDKLDRLDDMNERRRLIARRYDLALSGLPLDVPRSRGGDDVAHLYVVRTRDRDALMHHLRERAIGTEVHYPIPDHRQRTAEPTSDRTLPVTEAAAATVLSLPCYPGLSETAQSWVVDAIAAYFTSGAAS